MNLVIVESAAKAKTIAKYLNETPELKKLGRFKVIASFGHINDLPSKELGIDKQKWTGTYVPLDAKKKVIADMKKDVKAAKMIYIASDLDMEGEAIANHIRNTMNLDEHDYKRITFNEITKPALREAVLHPRQIDMKMVDAQEARRFLDRVVGYELSPLLWRRFATSRLSAGRVQSAALKMIVDKERESREHDPEPYWIMHGEFATGRTNLSAKTNASWDDEKAVAKVVRFLAKKASAKTCKWSATFTRRESKRNPSAPFTTSSLQQEAYNRLGLPAKRTMQIAQSLYEAGHITYMRTDSPNLSEQAKGAIVDYIETRYGADHVQTRVFKSKAANAQEAHECIRPTKVDVHNPDIDGIHKKLYDLIWRRTIASQMIPATFLDITFTIRSDCFDEEFRGNHDVLIKEGYLKVYNPEQKHASQSELDKWDDGQINVQPVSFKGQGDVTRPPPLYNEPSLVKALEKEGIGRPSTYAAIVDKLFSKGYVIKGTNPSIKTVHVNSYKWKRGEQDISKDEETVVVGGSDGDKFISTSLGERVIDYISETAPFIVQRKFTSDMEKELDMISDGHKKKKEVLNDFYKIFEVAITKAQAVSAKAKKEKKEDDKMPVCKPVSPSEKMVLHEFSRIGVKVVQTRYGPALLKESENKWVSLMPFLKWRKKTIEELTETDARFMYNLPVPVAATDGCQYQVHMGRYGLYIKDEKGNNTRLPKEKWNDVYDGKFVMSTCDISAFQKKLPRPRAVSSPRK